MKFVYLPLLAGLTVGKNYEMAIFHAERCFGESNFKAEMNLRQDQGVCLNQCHVVQERGYCDRAAGKCVCFDGWGGLDCGTLEGDAAGDLTLSSSCDANAGALPPAALLPALVALLLA